ncbi:hypothetical protein B296_00044288 [Ensete ventricosum]|uniref:Uncharacterized protein n=1 Tax=Ensete ventricosum TaxID=4639 RepID=A0A426YNC4_ENSVE|nr:hypothetical protein B296_00044288 [Ensete ventricosum]
MLLSSKDMHRPMIKRLRAVVVSGWEQKATAGDKGCAPVGSCREEEVAAIVERVVARKASCWRLMGAEGEGHDFVEEELSDGYGFAERDCCEDKKGKSKRPVDLKGRVENDKEELLFDSNIKQSGEDGAVSGLNEWHWPCVMHFMGC